MRVSDKRRILRVGEGNFEIANKELTKGSFKISEQAAPPQPEMRALPALPKKGTKMISETGLVFEITKALNRQRFIVTLIRPKNGG
jgi:hypothetical protein